MAVSVLLARVVLAGVFAVAAFGKLADREGSRLAVRDFGVPARAAGSVGLALPVLEVAIAAGLLGVGTAPWAAVVAVALLLTFCVAIARLMRRGEEPECNCFGSIGSAPVGRGTLVRNGVLLVVAGYVATAAWSDAGPSAVSWLGDVSALVAVIGVLMAAHFAFSWQLFRQNGRLLARIEDLEIVAGLSQSESPDADRGLELGRRCPGLDSIRPRR